MCLCKFYNQYIIIEFMYDKLWFAGSFISDKHKQVGIELT